MAEPPKSGFKYEPAPLSSLPPTLDPATYDASPEKRAAEAERVAIRARLKRQFMMQINDPRIAHIDDPAVTRWVYARTYNVYPNFRVTPKTSLLGAAYGLGPLFFWWYIFKTDRDKKEKLIQEGKYEREFPLFY